MLRRFTSLTLVVLIVLCFAACSKKADAEKPVVTGFSCDVEVKYGEMDVRAADPFISRNIDIRRERAKNPERAVYAMERGNHIVEASRLFFRSRPRNGAAKRARQMHTGRFGCGFGYA